MDLRVVRYSIYHSPNAYLGAVHADALLVGLPVTVERRPIFVPRDRGVLIADLVGGRETSRHGGYHREDCRRWADAHGVPLRFLGKGVFEERAARWAESEFEREELPARAFYASDSSQALDRALFEAAWVDGLDVNEESTVRAACVSAGLDADEVLETARSEAMGERVRASLAAFDAAEGPGVPLWILSPEDGPERFFGKDRVELLAQRVTARSQSR
jgi:2-hydroxychromene-2-carboxylate isomerase